jgi:hypothetical protein
MNSVFVRLGRGVGEKLLGLEAANGPRKFCGKFLFANETSRTQFVKNFDQRGRNISLGRAFRKRDPL